MNKLIPWLMILMPVFIAIEEIARCPPSQCQINLFWWIFGGLSIIIGIGLLILWRKDD